MKKRNKKLMIALALTLPLIIFVFGPTLGKGLMRVCTRQSDIQEWKTEFRQLDTTSVRTEENEAARIALAMRLARRGIDIDPGIRDEGVEHNLSIGNVFTRICWAWGELLN